METVWSKLADGINHPVVLVFGSRDDITQVILVVEGHAVPIVRGLVAAVDRMLKVYFVFNIEYPDPCKHVLHFLQCIIFCIADELPPARGASDLSLFLRRHVGK